MQEVLLRAWKDPGLVDRDDAAARAWLFTATRNLIIDRWRSAAFRHELGTADPPMCSRMTPRASSLIGG